MDVINNALNEDLCYGPDVTTEAIFGLEKAEVQLQHVPMGFWPDLG